MVTIAIIDSGINAEHPKLKNYKFKGVSISTRDGKLEIDNDISDSKGHGTAVAGIIYNSRIEADLFIVKVFLQEEMTLEPELLVSALQYIYDNVECEFILMSLGTPVLEDVDALTQICDQLSLRGTQIVSAFDNSGCLSYPACIKSVIGVDSADYIQDKGGYEIIDGDGVVDIRGKGGLHRVCWVEPPYRLMVGTSFTAAIVLTLLIPAYEAGARGKTELLDYLRANARRVISFEKETGKKSTIWRNMESVITYPFNKEIQTLLRYSAQLSYTVRHVCDEPLHGSIGKDIDKLLFGNDEKKRFIENIYEVLEYDDYDTVILGHLNELSILARKNLLEIMLLKCMEKHKRVYAFDNVNQYVDKNILDKAVSENLIFMYPECSVNLPQGRLGRLWVSSKPVIGVFGTSSRQGKFSVQLLLRQIFQEKGYQVGQLGTEPSSLLMGLEMMYPMGYDASVSYRNEQAVILLNEIMHLLERDNPDLIIVGGQSSTVSYEVNHIYDLRFFQWDFIVGTSPDLIILCVNPQDSIEYVRKTIGFLESVGHAKVISLVVFPIKLEQEWYGFSFKNKLLDAEGYEMFRQNFASSFDMPAYRLEKSEIDHMADYIIEYLSE